jgi:two-component system sensor histidine kinase BaeS
LTSALIGAVIAATAWTLTGAERGILQAQSRERLDGVTEGVSRLAEEGIRQHDPFMLLSHLVNLRKDHPEIAMAQVTMRGHASTIGQDGAGLIYWSRSVSEKRPVTYTISTTTGGATSPQLAVSTAGVSLTVPGQALVRIEEGRAPEFVSIKLGFVKASLDAEIDRALKPMIEKTVGIAGVFMLLGFGGAFMLGKLLTAPLTALSSAVALVGEGKLDVEVPARGNDEVGRLGRRFNEMTGKLSELMRFREDVLHTLTHELNTPLAGLKAYLELWIEQQPAGAPGSDVGPTMMAALQRMEHSLGSALQLFRSSAGIAEVDKKLVWVDELIREACVLFSMTAQSKKIEVSSIADGSAECLYADEALLRHVINNLFSNALKYTPEGGKVCLGLESDASELRFWVSDTGYGIKADDIPHLFTKFYRAQTGPKAGERIPGTGLGLSIAQKSVQAMGGMIEVESELGKGSTFRVRIPKLKQEAKS